MTIKRWNPKRDANEPEIVDYLTQRGCSVYRLDKPVDLLVGLRLGDWRIWVMAEVKADKGKLTDPQIKFMEDNAGFPIFILRTIADAEDMMQTYGMGA